LRTWSHAKLTHSQQQLGENLFVLVEHIFKKKPMSGFWGGGGGGGEKGDKLKKYNNKKNKHHKQKKY